MTGGSAFGSRSCAHASPRGAGDPHFRGHQYEAHDEDAFGEDLKNHSYGADAPSEQDGSAGGVQGHTGDYEKMGQHPSEGMPSREHEEDAPGILVRAWVRDRAGHDYGNASPFIVKTATYAGAPVGPFLVSRHPTIPRGIFK